jgi:protein required for attachment to host cells
MSPTELEAFDKSLQTKNTRPKELDKRIAPDRSRYCRALQAMLFTLRDWLTVDEIVHLSARLPLLVSASVMTTTGLPANRIASARAPGPCRSSTSISSRRGRLGLMKRADFDFLKSRRQTSPAPRTSAHHSGCTNMRRNKESTWLLIADGSRAKVFESPGSHETLNEIDDMALAIHLPKSGELLADRPGRTFDSVGAGRQAKEYPTNPHRLLKRDFASKVVEKLRRAMLDGRFDRIIFVAPPAFLGDLRQSLPKDLKNKEADEVTSDLTNMPEE